MQTREAPARNRKSKVAEFADSGVDAIVLLKEQHREVEALFEQIENAGEKAHKKKTQLFGEIADKITKHTKIEEAIFYPAAEEADEDLVLEAHEEHDNVKAMIRKIQRTKASDETFDAKIKTLKELVKHHVKEEEEQLFPKCVKALGQEALEELGGEMQEKYDALQKAH
jgi:hemerythrin-like domain-containing protein